MLEINLKKTAADAIICSDGGERRLKLTEKTKRWVELGVIDQAARDNILALYQRKHSLNPVYVLFAVLGSLLLGLGVILIFAVNWENMQRGVKVFFAFVPMLAAMGVFGYTVLKRRDSAAFREGAALGLCLSIFAAVALIDQIYQIPTELEAYIRLCTMLLFPAAYLLRSNAAAALFTVCVIWGGAGEYAPAWFAPAGAAAIAPFLALQIMKTGKKFMVWFHSVLSGALLTLLVFKLPGDSGEMVLKFLLCAAVLLTLDAFIKRYRDLTGFTVLTPLACLTFLIMLMISTFSGMDAGLGEIWFLRSAESAFYFLLFMFALALYAVVRFYKQPFEALTADAVALCALLGLPFFWLWSNFLLVALGVWFMVDGVRKFSIRVVNLGMLILICVIILRFFDSSLGLAERGVAFIITGAGFIGTNILLKRRWRARDEK